MLAKSKSSFSNPYTKSKAQSLAAITNDYGNNCDLLSTSDDIFTPYWNWQTYINKGIVPENLMCMMEDVKNYAVKKLPHYKPLTDKLNSDLSSTELEDKSSMDDRQMCLWNVVKYPKSRVTSEVFKMSGLEQLCAQKDDPAQKKKELADIDRGIQSMLSPTLNTIDFGISCYDFEMVFKPMNIGEHRSLAYFLTKRYKGNLTAAQMVTKCIRNYWYADMELQCGSRFCYVDSYIFTHFAQNFNFCLASTLRLPTVEVPIAVMSLLYNWMVTENLELDTDHQFIPLFIAGMFLGIRPLVEHYWSFLALGPEMGLCETTALEAYLRARVVGCEAIMPILADKVRKLFIPLVASKEFLDLTAPEVSHLFKQDTLCVNCEDEIFFAALRWLEFNWLVRKKFILQIMSAIRFPHLSPWLRRSLEHSRENNLIKEISELPLVTAWLWDSVKYCIARMTETATKKVRKRSVFGKYLRNKCTERYWVYCPGMPHHHDVKCPRFRELTYNTYKQELIQVQKQTDDYIDSLKFIPNKHWSTFECCNDINLNAENTRTCRRPEFYAIENP